MFRSRIEYTKDGAMTWGKEGDPPGRTTPLEPLQHWSTDANKAVYLLGDLTARGYFIRIYANRDPEARHYTPVPKVPTMYEIIASKRESPKDWNPDEPIENKFLFKSRHAYFATAVALLILHMKEELQKK